MSVLLQNIKDLLCCTSLTSFQSSVNNRNVGLYVLESYCYYNLVFQVTVTVENYLPTVTV